MPVSRRNQASKLLCEAFAAEAFLTKGKKVKKIRYQSLHPEMKVAYDDAMRKE